MKYSLFFSLNGERLASQADSPKTVRHLISCINSETPSAGISVFYGYTDVTDDFIGNLRIESDPVTEAYHQAFSAIVDRFEVG